jgi:hypothetical protein
VKIHQLRLSDVELVTLFRCVGQALRGYTTLDQQRDRRDEILLFLKLSALVKGPRVEGWDWETLPGWADAMIVRAFADARAKPGLEQELKAAKERIKALSRPAPKHQPRPRRPRTAAPAAGKAAARGGASAVAARRSSGSAPAAAAAAAARTTSGPAATSPASSPAAT